MSQAIVGRIFWKELRVQRAFWVWILGLGAFIQLLPILFGRAYYRTAVDFHWFNSVNIVIACCFAVGSTAIAFAGESEARTKSLFQRLPVRAADLLAGKLGWSFLGTYALLSILGLTANLWSEAWGGATSHNNMRSRLDFNPQTSEFWLSLLTPLPFLVVGVLCSLALRDVLTTVAVAGMAAAVLMGSLNWTIAAGVVVALAIGDGLLVPYWLRDSLLSSLGLRLPRFASTRTAPGHSTLSVRSSTAWRRAASSLVWKESWQAIALTLTLAAAGALTIILVAAGGSLEYREYGSAHLSLFWIKDCQVFVSMGLTIVPLFFGIAAGRADRRDGAYRLLAHRGVSPNAHWLTKHAVWLVLAVAAVLWLLGWQRLMLSAFPTPGREESLWEVARTAANAPFFGDPAGPAGFVATLAIVLFEVVLLYALGHLLSLVIPSAMTALVLGLIGWACVALLWATAMEYDVPFSWTIGLLPLIFLLAGWLRTQDWLVDRNSLAAWGRVAASLAVPILGICCGVAVFRVVQIPAVSLPLEIRNPQPQPAIEGRSLKESLFVDALTSLSDAPRRRENRPEETAGDGWALADVQTQNWVRANERARKLALEAARQEPGDFQSIVWTQNILDARVSNLANLLVNSASQLESESRLEEALQDYVAMARLGDDLERSNRVPFVWRAPLTRTIALNAMDHWAAHPKQTPELIQRAIGLFQHFEQDAPLLSPQLLRDWRLERELFQDYVWKGNNPSEENRSTAETGFVRWCLPWELLRLQRLQDALFSTALDQMQLVERELHDRRFVDARLITFDDLRQTPWKWARTTLDPPNVSPSGLGWTLIPAWRVNHAATADLHFLVWAAADYRREHHKLPAALSELVPTYFTSLPIDPWTGRDFLYEPTGVPVDLHSLALRLEPNQPFIASGGASDCRIELNRILGREIAPVRVLTRSGRDLNEGPQLGALYFPAPAVAIPDLSVPPKTTGKLPEPRAKPPSGKTRPTDRLLAKPVRKLDPASGPTKK